MDSRIAHAARLATVVEDLIAADRVLKRMHISINTTTEGKLSITFSKPPPRYAVKRLDRLIGQARKQLRAMEEVPESEAHVQTVPGPIVLISSQSK